MALPETDLHRIRLWARDRLPECLCDELKAEAASPTDTSTSSWCGHRGTASASTPNSDCASALHEVVRPVGDLLARSQPEVPRVQAQAPDQERPALLDHIETSGDPIFWG